MIVEICVLSNGGDYKTFYRHSSEETYSPNRFAVFCNKVTIESVRQAYKPADSVVDVGNGERICSLKVVMRYVF
jgi:hypothetical protein